VSAPLAPEQQARVVIDAKLEEAGWTVQSRDAMNLGAGPGVAVREFQTEAGPCDYLLFAGGKPVGMTADATWAVPAHQPPGTSANYGSSHVEVR